MKSYDMALLKRRLKIYNEIESISEEESNAMVSNPINTNAMK